MTSAPTDGRAGASKHSGIGFVPWVLAAGSVALLAMAALALGDAIRIRDVMTSGTETMALVDGGAAGIRSGLAGAHLIDVRWLDSAGTERKARALPISEPLARQLLAAPPDEALAVLIRYLPDLAPVVVLQAALEQEANRLRLAAGAAGGGLAAAAFLITVWLRRRRARK